MAILDGLISQVLPVTGETTVNDTVDSTAFSTTDGAVATLVDIAGEKAWNITGGSLSKGIPSTSYGNQWGNEPNGSGVTYAVRLSANSWGGNNYDDVVGAGKSSTDTRGTARLTRYSSITPLRAKSTNNTISIPSIDSLSTVYTVVVKVHIEGGSSVDQTQVWVNQTSRADNSADYLGSLYTQPGETLAGAFFNCGSSRDIDFLDLAIWNRELSDAECVLVADDIRTALSTETPPPDESDTVPDAYSFTDQADVPLSTQVESDVNTVTGIDASATISITGGEYSINSGAYTSADGNVDLNDTVQLRTTSSAEFLTATDVNVDIGGVLDTWTVTTVAETTGTLTTQAFKNNTGFVLASQSGVTIDVYDPADGTLVLRKTGLTTSTTGVCVLSDPLILTGETYNILITLPSGATGHEILVAT